MKEVKAMLAALRLNYLRDLPSHIDELEELVLELEREGFDLERCRELYRRVHSLKGSGSTYGMHTLSDVCHPFEDCLSNLIEQPSLLKTSFLPLALQYIDLLRQVVTIYSDGAEPGAETKQALQALRLSSSKASLSALLVEGSEVIAGLLKDVLKDQGFRIEMFDDGYLALGRALSEHFDLIVTSQETKRLNGQALISAVQKSSLRTSVTKTILMTSMQTKAGAGGPDFVLHKDAQLKEKFRAIVLELVHAHHLPS